MFFLAASGDEIKLKINVCFYIHLVVRGNNGGVSEALADAMHTPTGATPLRRGHGKLEQD